MSARSDAFRVPVPADWIPAVGEECFINHGRVAWCRVDVVLAEDVFRISFPYGGRHPGGVDKRVSRVVVKKDLRPIPERKRRGKRADQS